MALELDKVEITENTQQLTSFSTNLLILEKFVKDYEVCLNYLFNQNTNLLVNFDEFAKIFYELGFIKIPYDSTLVEDDKKENKEKLEQENPDLRIQRFRRKNEHICLKDAWKILTGGNPDLDKIDTNQLIVFCASILGLYPGDDPNAPKEETKSNYLKTNESNPSLSIKKERSLSPKRNMITTPKNFTLGFGTYERGFSALKLSRNDTDQSSARLKKKEKVLLKLVLPDLNLSRFSYHPKTVKQIHSIFHQLYNNRVAFLLENKKKDELKKSSKTENIPNSPFDHKNHLNERTIQSASNYRSKLYNVIKLFSYYIIYYTRILFNLSFWELTAQ